MQADLDAEFPGVVQILGVNDVGFEGGNATITDGRDLPWLQNTADADLWNAWNVTYRDVWVLDGDNIPVGIFNVTGNNLSDAANYETLRALFVEAMGD